MFPQYFSYILSINFIGEGDRRTPSPPTHHQKKKKKKTKCKSLTKLIHLATVFFCYKWTTRNNEILNTCITKRE